MNTSLMHATPTAKPPRTEPGDEGDPGRGRQPGVLNGRNGIHGARLFSRIIAALERRLDFFEVDYAGHWARAMLPAKRGGHVVFLAHNPARHLVRLQVNLKAHGAIRPDRLPAVFRIEDGVWLVRIIPDLEDAAVRVQTASLCPDTASGPTVIVGMLHELAGVLNDDRLLAILEGSDSGNGVRQGGVA